MRQRVRRLTARTRHPSTPVRAAVLATASLAALSAAAPSAAFAVDDHRARHDVVTIAPADTALTGGVVRLRSPGATMLRLPATRFVMGSSAVEVVEAEIQCKREPLAHRCDAALFSDELPARDVTLSSYWLDRTEVTVEAYVRCVELRRCAPQKLAEGAGRFGAANLPATFVTFDDAEAYCRFRGARLPTEAEFERAARGARGRTYPWGNHFGTRLANHGRLGLDRSDDSDGFLELAPVGSFPAGRTPEGLLDLAGNVAEWVSDRHAPYPSEASSDPVGPTSPLAGSRRVARGGHYQSAAPFLRGAARGPHEPPRAMGPAAERVRGLDPTTRAPFVGFRCARSSGRPRQVPVERD